MEKVIDDYLTQLKQRVFFMMQKEKNVEERSPFDPCSGDDWDQVIQAINWVMVSLEQFKMHSLIYETAAEMRLEQCENLLVFIKNWRVAEAEAKVTKLKLIEGDNNGDRLSKATRSNRESHSRKGDGRDGTPGISTGDPGYPDAG